MKFIVENWFVIVAIAAVGGSIGYAIYSFVKMPSDKQLNKVREWLLYAVTKAEKELGAGTGKLKLRYVYDMFVARFEWLAKVITAVNNMVGYCQSHRGTFWTNLADSNFDPAQITVPCEADCSSGVAAIVKGAGYRLKNEKLKNVSTACYTGNLRAALKAAGFEVLTDKKYLTSDAYLLEGDILLNDGAHVATNLTNGAKASGGGASQTVPINSNVKLETAKGFNKSLAGTYKVTGAGALNLRSGAGTGKDKKVLTTMQSGETCQCYGYYTDASGVKWLYVAYKNVVGFASSKYLKK